MDKSKFLLIAIIGCFMLSLGKMNVDQFKPAEAALKNKSFSIERNAVDIPSVSKVYGLVGVYYGSEMNQTQQAIYTVGTVVISGIQGAAYGAVFGGPVGALVGVGTGL